VIHSSRRCPGQSGSFVALKSGKRASPMAAERGPYCAQHQAQPGGCDASARRLQSRKLWPFQRAGGIPQAGASRKWVQFAGLLQQHSGEIMQCCRPGLDPGERTFWSAWDSRVGRGSHQGYDNMPDVRARIELNNGATLLSVACMVTTLQSGE